MQILFISFLIIFSCIILECVIYLEFVLIFFLLPNIYILVNLFVHTNNVKIIDQFYISMNEEDTKYYESHNNIVLHCNLPCGCMKQTPMKNAQEKIRRKGALLFTKISM